jgi:hypothetical protein
VAVDADIGTGGEDKPRGERIERSLTIDIEIDRRQPRDGTEMRDEATLRLLHPEPVSAKGSVCLRPFIEYITENSFWIAHKLYGVHIINYCQGKLASASYAKARQ